MQKCFFGQPKRRRGEASVRCLAVRTRRNVRLFFYIFYYCVLHIDRLRRRRRLTLRRRSLRRTLLRAAQTLRLFYRFSTEISVSHGLSNGEYKFAPPTSLRLENIAHNGTCQNVVVATRQ